MSSEQPVDPKVTQEPVVEASQTQSQGSTSAQTALPDDIRQQVEQEQALADAQKRLKELEADNERLQKEKKEVEEARDSSGTLIPQDQKLRATLMDVASTTNQLRTQLNQLQTTHHSSSSELSVIQLRIDVSLEGLRLGVS
jgi:nucleoprotein TPR